VAAVDPNTAASTTSLTLTEWIGVFGFIISFLLAIGKAIEIFHDRRDRIRDLRAKSNDEWFRVVVFDSALPELLRFLKQSRELLVMAKIKSGVKARPYAEALQGYLTASELLKRDLIPIGDLEQKVYVEIEKQIEMLDDLVSPYCAHADDNSFEPIRLEAEWKVVSNAFETCHSECLTLLRQLHTRLLKGVE
jgi:hypothetical protein